MGEGGGCTELWGVVEVGAAEVLANTETAVDCRDDEASVAVLRAPTMGQEEGSAGEGKGRRSGGAVAERREGEAHVRRPAGVVGLPENMGT